LHGTVAAFEAESRRTCWNENVTREIPASQWRDFLDEFSRAHRAWLATVDSATGGVVRVQAVERRLRSVSLELDADRVVRLDIRFQDESGSSPAVQVVSPVTVRVEETAEGATRGLEIMDEEGGCTRIRFRTATTATMLDGVAPGELLQ
jgi:hypothetical protein